VKKKSRENNFFTIIILFFISLCVLFPYFTYLPAKAGIEDLNLSPIKNNSGNELFGYVDMHTHPMAHLGFGKKLLHGAPDIGSIVPAGTYNCNINDFRAETIDQALGSCASTHGMYVTKNYYCGDHIRRQVITTIEGIMGSKAIHGEQPYKMFETWPKYNDIMHQKMWVDWIKRAYQGGLRVMVTLAVNNRTLADGINGNLPNDDKSTGDLQIDELKSFVFRHKDFMEIAYNPLQLRQIVKSNKLAIIIGIELDNIGNFNSLPYKKLTRKMISTEINRLYDKGVRYIFPVHVIDNHFAGTSVYLDVFNFSNRREIGRYWDLQCAKKEENISHRYSFYSNIMMTMLAFFNLGINPFDVPPLTPNCPTGIGYINKNGLTDKGRYAIILMMEKGIMIDIDHLSEVAVEDVFHLAEEYKRGYPLNSSHNSIRKKNKDNSENSRSAEQLKKIASLGGMFGLGLSGIDAPGFLIDYRTSLEAMGNRNVSLGTDSNGFIVWPGPRKGSNVIYDENFPMCQTGSKTWDYNKDGVAHYGLLPDFLTDLKNLGGDKELESLFKSAEYFAQMWEKCQRLSDK
jgi:microsomal dipeptidase-like Zn-dependent dipeptidase